MSPAAPADAALSELFDLLERRFALRVLWALREPAPLSFRALQAALGGMAPGTLNTRLKELRDASLLVHNGEGYALTTAGVELTKRLGDLPSFARRLAGARAKREARPSAAKPRQAG